MSLELRVGREAEDGEALGGHSGRYPGSALRLIIIIIIIFFESLMGQFLQDPERSVFSAHLVRSALLLSRHRIIIDSRSLCWVKSCKRPMSVWSESFLVLVSKSTYFDIFLVKLPRFSVGKKTRFWSKHPQLLERKRPNIWNFSAVGRRKGN